MKNKLSPEELQVLELDSDDDEEGEEFLDIYQDSDYFKYSKIPDHIKKLHNITKMQEEKTEKQNKNKKTKLNDGSQAIQTQEM